MLKLIAMCAVGLAALFVASCGGNGGVPIDACAWVEPIEMSEADIRAVSEDLARDLLAHNEAWEENCA